MEAGLEFDVKPCGLGARDTLRIGNGVIHCMDNEIDEDINPLEAGLSRYIKIRCSMTLSVRNPWLIL